MKSESSEVKFTCKDHQTATEVDRGKTSIKLKEVCVSLFAEIKKV